MTYQEAKNYKKELKAYKAAITAELDAVGNAIDENEGEDPSTDIGSLPTSPPPPPPPRP